MTMQILCRALHEELDNPGAWLLGDYTLRHKRSKLELWMGNGYFFFKTCRPTEVPFPLFWKIRLYRKARRLRKLLEDRRRDKVLEAIALDIVAVDQEAPAPAPAQAQSQISGQSFWMNSIYIK